MSASVLPGDQGRLDRIDLLRATAMIWMTVYHFCFDLNHFGIIEQNFYRDPFWTWQRTAIVSLFLFTAGLSQAVALQQGQGWPRFWKRWVQVAGGALLVAAEQYLIGVPLLLVGLAASWRGAKSLHQLSRRWIVFVPAGFVIHDYWSLAESPLKVYRIEPLAPEKTRALPEDEPLLSSPVAPTMRSSSA